jgi:uncharacterized membrane protein
MFAVNFQIRNKQTKEKHPNRFIELDLLRGFAIIFMVFLHIIWDLDYFGIMPLNQNIYQFQKIVPSIFFILVGVCLAVTYNRSIKKQDNDKKTHIHLIIRGLKILNLGIIISIGTMIFIPDRPIFFGVLHFIGVSIILSVPFLKLKNYNIAFAPLLILMGILFNNIIVEDPTLLHLVLGIHQSNIGQFTIDYFPLLPWFGVVLLGISLGNIIYCNGEQRRFRLPDLSRYRSVTTISWLGKNSLSIYLIHQPIIAGAITLFTFI